jgi:hypothetical protein
LEQVEPQVNLVAVCEEFRPDGDDLLTVLAINYALRGLGDGPAFKLRPGDRADMTPDEVRASIAGSVAGGARVVVAVVLDARVPTVGEAREMEAAYWRATSREGAAEIRAGRASLPERFSDDWVWEVGPRCAAAIAAAQDCGCALVVVVPPVRWEALTRGLRAALDALEDGEQRRELVESASVGLRCGEQRLRVPAASLADAPHVVALHLLRVAAEVERERAASEGGAGGAERGAESDGVEGEGAGGAGEGAAPDGGQP